MSATYTPHKEDVDLRVAVDYTPVKADGSEGETKRCIAQPIVPAAPAVCQALCLLPRLLLFFLHALVHAPAPASAPARQRFSLFQSCQGHSAWHYGAWKGVNPHSKPHII